MVPSVAIMPPQPKKRDDKAVKIDRDLATKAGMNAEMLGYDSIAEYLSHRLRPIIERDFPKALAILEERKREITKGQTTPEPDDEEPEPAPRPRRKRPDAD